MGDRAVTTATATSLLDAVAGASSRAIVVLQPILDGDRLVDAELVWCTESAKLLNPTFQPGIRFVDSDEQSKVLREETAHAVLRAWRSPGTRFTRNAFTVERDGREFHLTATIMCRDGLVVIEYDDVTEIERHRSAVEASEHNFRELLDGLDAGVVLLRPSIDPDTGRVDDAEITWSNVASRRMWLNHDGLEPGTRVRSVYYDADDWLDAATRAWRGETSTRMLQVDPAVAPWTSATETLRRVGDVLVELTLDRTNDQLMVERLRELDFRYASLLEDLPLTVLVARVGNDEMEFVSPNAVALTGRPLADLRTVGQWSSMVHESDHHERERIIRSTIDTGKGEGVMRYVRGDGSTFTAAVRVIHRSGPAGNGFITLITDISEQQQLRERLEAGERLETLGRTAGSIAHDFNNLLMIVSGNLDRVRRQLGTDSIPLDTATVAAQRAADLAHSLLAFARGRHGDIKPVSVEAMLKNFEPILRGVVRTDAVLERQHTLHDARVLIDITHLQQVLLNLVTNARDAGPAGGTVTISAEVVPHAACHLLDHPAKVPHVAISVTDRGPGIPPEIANRIWEPFFSSKQLTNDSGSGLGLSTVHGLVHQHGGHVAVATAPEGGTTFTIYLPVHE